MSERHGTTILRGGRPNYQTNTLMGNWQEDRVVTDNGAPRPECPGYETTKEDSNLKANGIKPKRFGNRIPDNDVTEKSVYSYQDEKTIGPIVSIGHSAQESDTRDAFQKEFGSKFPLKPAREMKSDELEKYRSEWSKDDEIRDMRFVTNNAVVNNSTVSEKFKSRQLRKLPNVPVSVQNLQEQLLEKQGPHCLRKLQKSMRFNDDDESGNISRNDLRELLKDCGVSVEFYTYETIWKNFDLKGRGFISYDVFLNTLAGPLPANRQGWVSSAYDTLRQACPDHRVLLRDVLEGFQLNGSGLYGRIAKEFTQVWPFWEDDEDISRDDFMEYYRFVSPAFDSDDEFHNFVQKSWGM